MHKLEIGWMELEAAFQISSGGLVEMHHYLDLEMGEGVMVTSEVTRYLEEPPGAVQQTHAAGTAPDYAAQVTSPHQRRPRGRVPRRRRG